MSQTPINQPGRADDAGQFLWPVGAAHGDQTVVPAGGMEARQPREDPEGHVAQARAHQIGNDQPVAN